LKLATKNKLSVIIMLCLGFALMRMPSEKVCLEIKDQHLCLRVLRDKSDKNRGFQLVEEVCPNEGLLYFLTEPKKPNFWMKDVFQHLDILFIDTHGQVLELVQAHPHRRDLITPPKKTMYVIELMGGRAKQLNLVKGAQLSHEALSGFKGALFAGY
jgi:uncharacterized membrane protein (UPF0127 family)